jgi:magnesium chelatase family protein
VALEQVECLGELALSGAFGPCRACCLPHLAARAAGRALVVPLANAEEACLASG